MKKLISKNFLFEFVFIAFIPLLYWKYIPDWFNKWSDVDSYYAFGFFVFAFILYLIKTNYEKLINIHKENYYPGILVIIVGLILYIIGYRSDYDQLVCLSLPMFIGGIVLTCWGRKTFSSILFPLILFTATLPIFPLYRIALPLQLISTKISSFLLNILGIESTSEGTLITVHNYRIAVVAACSGLKSSTSLFLIGVIYSYFLNAKLLKKVLFILFSIPLAVVMNSLRIAIVGLYTLYNGYNGMQEFHDNLGIVIFIISIGIMLLLSKFIDDNKYMEEKNEN